MNILFDQTEAQALFYNGAAEYAQVVFFKMLSLLDKYPEVNVVYTRLTESLSTKDCHTKTSPALKT